MYKRLDEEFYFMPKSKIKAGEGIDNGQYPFFTSSDIKVSTLNEYLFDDELIILGTGGKPSCNYFNGKFAVSTDNFVLKSKGNILTKYLYYYLRKNNMEILEQGFHGAGLKHIGKDYISQLSIPFVNIDLQNEIISVLDKLNNVIELNKKELELLDEAIKSRFIEMFGDPIENNYNFPKGIIGDYIVDVRYGTSKPAKDGGNYQYLRMNNLTYDGYLDYENVKYIDATDEDIDKYGIKYGDVLFNRTNSIDLIGKTAVYLENEIKIVAGYIIRVRFNECINPIYFTRYMNLPSTKKILREMAKGAVNQANINAQELKGISLIAPPMPLQDEFASFVEQIDKLKFIDMLCTIDNTF